MKKFFKTNLILTTILIMAAMFRFWQLNTNPPGLTWDEAALGYNAYSLMQTSRDEYGTVLPLNLKSFGDYKPAVYAYIDIPFVAVLGLNEWAVRFPSALAGVGSVLVLFLLVKEITKDNKLALLSSLMLAISPFALQFSRVAFESNLAVFFNLLGIYLFIKSFQRSSLLIYSALIFGLSIFTYQSSRIIVPLLLLALIITCRNKLRFNEAPLLSFRNKTTLVSAAIISVFFIVFIYSVFALGQSNRLSSVSLWSYQRPAGDTQDLVNWSGFAPSNWKFQLLLGQWWFYVRGFAERYLSYFSPKMLFIDGDYNQRDRVPDMGTLYYISLLLIPCGIYYLWRKRHTDKNNLILLFPLWFLIGAIPAALSKDLLSLLRNLNIVMPLSVFEGAGLYLIFYKSYKLGKIVSTICYLVVGGALVFNILIYLDRYYVHMPKEYSKYWLYGNKQAVLELAKLQQQTSYDHIYMTDTYGQPYIYYLFYTKYPPAKYQSQAMLDQPSVDVGTVRKIDNIEFRHIYWPDDRSIKNSLFIGTPNELPDPDIKPYSQYSILDQINFLDGTPAFKIVESQ